MRWSKDQDLIQLMEILLFELYSQNTYSPECERVWEQIAENLNSQREDKILFKITQRSVRDRFHVLKTTLPSEKRDEEPTCGISPKISEFDECLGVIIERFKERDENQRKENEEKKKRAK